jgi:type VI secretion system protein ImpK
MFGSKGPTRRRGGPARQSPQPRGGNGVLETVVVESSSRRRAAPAARSGPMPSAKPRLVDLAADWLSTALAIGQAAELPDAHALRARALELKSRFERDAGAHGFNAADVEDAVFAMVALLDQTVLNQRGPARDTWIGRPLQLELYGRQLAGEEFFERLDKLRHERETRIEALEVYGCCLGFGFTGRYQLTPEKLPALIEDVQADITAARGAGLAPLAPNSGRSNERIASERRGMAWWLPPAIFVPAVLVIWLLIWLIAKLGAGGAASAISRLAR